MAYSELLRAAVTATGTAAVAVSDDWLQGRSVFGGLQAAVALLAMRTLVPADVPLRTLQVTFVAPVPAGTVSATAKILRSGKSATQVEARLVDGNDTLAVAIAVFGAARESAIARLPQQPPVDSAAPKLMRFMPGAMPNFLQHFEARWLRGGLPFSGSPVPEMIVDLAMRDAGPCSEAHVLAMADFIPPVALAMLPKVVPGSSVTWMLELLRDRFDDLPLAGWRIDAEMIAARDGYTNQSTMVWGPNGVPIALSRQSMVVFA